MIDIRILIIIIGFCSSHTGCRSPHPVIGDDCRRRRIGGGDAPMVSEMPW